MENEPQQIVRKEAIGNGILKLLGITCLIFVVLSFVVALALDLTGEKATGKVSNVSVGCPPGKSCWTGKVEFTTRQGKEVSFYPMTFPMLFDFDPFLSGRPYEEYGNYQVRYFENYPQIAKIKLAYFLEYSSHVFGCCLGAFLLLVASAFSSKSGKARKPIVIDLGKLRNK